MARREFRSESSRKLFDLGDLEMAQRRGVGSDTLIKSFGDLLPVSARFIIASSRGLLMKPIQPTPMASTRQ